MATRAPVQLALHHEPAVVGVLGRADPLNVFPSFVQTVHRVRRILHRGSALPGRANGHADRLSVSRLRRCLQARCVSVRVRVCVRVRVHRRGSQRRGRGTTHVRGRRVQPLVTHRLVGGHTLLWIPPEGQTDVRFFVKRSYRTNYLTSIRLRNETYSRHLLTKSTKRVSVQRRAIARFLLPTHLFLPLLFDVHRGFPFGSETIIYLIYFQITDCHTDDVYEG